MKNTSISCIPVIENVFSKLNNCKIDEKLVKHTVTSNRSAIVARYFMHSGEILHERRRGYRPQLENKEVSCLFKAHIKSYT